MTQLNAYGTEKVETLIIGAGVIGSSLAMHLAELGMTDVRVIDFDMDGSLSSSELNAGGVRATWAQPLNIILSQRSIEYFSTVADEVGYRPCGYLWLHPTSRWEAALKARARQVEFGWPVEAWDILELQRKIPFLDKTDGIQGAIFAPRDGLINPNLLKNHYRAKARKAGAVFDDRTLLRKVEYTSEGQYSVQVTAERFEPLMSPETKLEVAAASTSQTFGKTQVKYLARRVVNCAGPWAAGVAEILGYKSPSFCQRRQISIFDCREVDLTRYGMIVDTTGVYFHPEATNGLAGFATPQEPHGVNYQYDGENFFMETIWPALYERSTSFEKLKHLGGWAGLYEVSPDESAIIGPVVQREVAAGAVFEAHSFSGHGVMHSYSVGLALAERIMKGRYETVNLNSLGASRFDTGELVHENLVI